MFKVRVKKVMLADGVFNVITGNDMYVDGTMYALHGANYLMTKKVAHIAMENLLTFYPDKHVIWISSHEENEERKTEGNITYIKTNNFNKTMESIEYEKMSGNFIVFDNIVDLIETNNTFKGNRATQCKFLERHFRMYIPNFKQSDVNSIYLFNTISLSEFAIHWADIIQCVRCKHKNGEEVAELTLRKNRCFEVDIDNHVKVIEVKKAVL